MSDKLSGHVIALGNWGAEFHYTRAVEDAMRSLNILLGPRGFMPGSVPKFRMNWNIELEPYASLPLFCNEFYSMGAFSYAWSNYAPGTKVGRYCSIANEGGVFIGHHPLNWASTSNASFMCDDIAQQWAIKDFNGGVFKPHPYTGEQPYPTIENDIWIGRAVLISPAVTIGTGAILAAGSVITKNVPPYAIVGGNPARIIRMRIDEKYIEPLLKSQWWQYDIRVLTKCTTPDIPRFLDDLEKWVSEENIQPYKPEKITFRHLVRAVAKVLGPEQIDMDYERMMA